MAERAGAPGELPAPRGGVARMSPAARPLVTALSAAFPDLGGTVTDAAEARRILAAAPVSRKVSLAVGAVVERNIPGIPEACPAGVAEVPARTPAPAAAEVLVRAYFPDPERFPRPHPTVVFFHGGGYTLGGLDSYDATARRLTVRSGAVVVSVGYRLAPEHRFPAAVDDAYAALCWAADACAVLGGAPGALVVAGDSSGGGLAAAVALKARDDPRGPAIARQVLIYPVLDASQSTASYRENATGCFLTAAHMRWFWQQYLGPDGDGAHPLASPLRAADLAGLPPAHLVTAGCDPLSDEGLAYAHRLRAAGVPVTGRHWPGMFHGFVGFPELLPEAEEALHGVAEAIASTVKGRKNSGEGGGAAG
ncbi:alpha/beta hydrolase [Streptomyces sp. G5(2025)]|uniref:alpha/beta hydrolase n=1 Tax=Streptomyces sp. G5(2025) TaxID=3406628 RepID=UPI003C2AA365